MTLQSLVTADIIPKLQEEYIKDNVDQLLCAHLHYLPSSSWAGGEASSYLPWL